MNAQTMAKRAYSSAQAPVRTARGIEYEAFARITHKLRAADPAEPGGFARLAEALHQNRQLWTLLAADVTQDENALPRDLRARIFYLAEFTHHHSVKVLNRQAEVADLIDINTAIMRGLRGNEVTT